MTAADPSELQSAIEAQGTVTGFLEHVTGERIFAEVVAQEPLSAGCDHALAGGSGQFSTYRLTRLRGAISKVPYLCAESLIAPHRLPQQVTARLENTEDPIGRVLVDSGLDPRREALAGLDAGLPHSESKFAAEVVLTRAYRLLLDGLPIFAIREWYLRSVLDALDRTHRH